MKAILVLAVILVGAFCVNPLHEQLMKDVFSQWKLAHNKAYKAGFEDSLRLSIFTQNYAKITEMNQLQSDFTLGLNQFADLTSEEFGMLYTGYNPSARRSNVKTAPVLRDLPSTVDWREKGAVTPVKNQGSCGSCWAFSAVGALEGLYFIENHKLVSFSEQNLVDCDKQSSGCGGGLMSWAFEYTEKAGIETESDYPYTAHTSKCAANPSKAVHVNNGYVNVTAKSVDALKTAIVAGPVSVAIQANQVAFQFYKTGIIKKFCGDKLDHGVLAVGYDDEAFIVKNSWGSGWGRNGYVYIGTDATINKGSGVCGILADACYPTNS